MTGYLLDHPFAVARSGRTATTTEDDHVRDLILQVLFTAPGERANRPDFGCGLLQRVFDPNGGPLATATEHLVRASLQRWLGDVIEVLDVEVSSVEERLHVAVEYRRLDTGAQARATFAAPEAAP